MDLEVAMLIVSQYQLPIDPTPSYKVSMAPLSSANQKTKVSKKRENETSFITYNVSLCVCHFFYFFVVGQSTVKCRQQ